MQTVDKPCEVCGDNVSGVNPTHKMRVRCTDCVHRVLRMNKYG